MLSDVVQQSQAFVTQRFKEADTSKLIYHDLYHTKDVVKRILFLAKDLKEEEQCLLQIAGWFHDVGYLYGYDNHEHRGMEIAEKYLNNKMLVEQIEVVTNCIEATIVALLPRTELEEIIKDADIGFGATENFFRTGPKLRKEWLLNLEKEYENLEWEKIQLNFLENVFFYSKEARQHYQPALEKNISKQKEKLEKLNKNN